MLTIIRNLVKSKAIAGVLATAAVAVVPSFAMADHRGWDRDDWRGRRDWHDDHHDHGGGFVGISIGGGGYCPPPVGPPPICAPARPVIVEDRVWVEPVYRTVCDQRWVPATYRTVIDRVWVAPVTRTQCDRVWVEPRYEWVDGQRVMTEPGHYVDGQPREVVVTPGHYEDRSRQELVADGHYESFERQELAVPDHFETRCREVVAVAPPPVIVREEPRARIDLRFPIGH